MQDKIDAFKLHVIEASANPEFIHHQWFVTWHLDIVARIADELLEYYPAADRDLVQLMVWLHDYGKILDFDNQYAVTLRAGRTKLEQIGFPETFIDQAISNIEILDKKMEVDLHQAPIEVQIVSSADGCSHMVGPFLDLWWYENASKPYEELMEGNKAKIEKDWNRKIVLPEARAAFAKHHEILLQNTGNLPAKFL